MRIDKWLWNTRFYKTRGLASKAVSAGHVSINNSKARPASKLAIGDEVQLRRDQLDYQFTVTALPDRRGPAKEAQACYAEDPEAIAARERLLAELRLDRKLLPRTDGRPDKRTRRKLRDRSRGNDS